MTNPTTTPPLPDWLDVAAKDIGANEPMEYHRAWYRERAARLMSGRYLVCRDGSVAWVATPGSLFRDDLTPHECIARWAGDDAERWRSIAFELIDIGEIWERIPVEILRADHAKDFRVMLYIVCNAEPAQLDRALVNAGWDDWRAKYNRRREAEEVRDEEQGAV